MTIPRRSRHPPATFLRSPHPRPSRARPQPARAVAETALPFPRAPAPRPHPSGRHRSGGAALLGEVAVLDQLDPVAVGIADEGDAAAGGAAAGAVGRLLGLDAGVGEGRRGWRRGRRRRGRCGCSRCPSRRSRRRGCRSARGSGRRPRGAMKTLIASSPIGIRRDLGEAELLVEGDRAVDVADPVAGVEEGVGHGASLSSVHAPPRPSPPRRRPRRR